MFTKPTTRTCDVGWSTIIRSMICVLGQVVLVAEVQDAVGPDELVVP